MSKEAAAYLLSIKFDDAHLPDVFNDDDKSYYTIPELMESYHREQMEKVLGEVEDEYFENGKRGSWRSAAWVLRKLREKTNNK